MRDDTFHLVASIADVNCACCENNYDQPCTTTPTKIIQIQLQLYIMTITAYIYIFLSVLRIRSSIVNSLHHRAKDYFPH